MCERETFQCIIRENAALAERSLKAAMDRILYDPAYHAFAPLEQAMRYSLLAGGKRLRPCLVFEFSRLFGGKPEDCASYAAAIEMVHTFSLIHDDMPCMDDDALRRGKPTNHKVFGEATALLAGDALLAFAFETLPSPTLSDRQNLEASRLLAHATGPFGMCAGQQIDLASEALCKIQDGAAAKTDENAGERQRMSLSALETLHAKKTGALIRAACLLGCIAAGVPADAPALCAAEKYASALGLAFQIADDILDVTGDEQKLGKKCGSDEKDHKTTYVTLLGVDGAKAAAQKVCAEAKAALSQPQAGIFDDRACAFLRELADYVVERES